MPVTIKMRHDSHYVEDLAGKNRAIGRTIPINLIEPNPEQPRTEIGDLAELSGSIKEKGVLEPILVKPNRAAGTWMIIAGERRWRAANLAGLTEMPCVELDISEKDVAEIALIENLQRKDLTIWEEVDGYAYLIEKFDYTHDEIARKIGKSRTTITESLTVAGLPDEIRAKCREAGISAKSALLEVARQFDEAAMHDFLENFNNQTHKRQNRGTNNLQKKNSTVNQTAKGSTVEVQEDSNPNCFKFTSADNKFELKIIFSNSASYEKSDVLNALREVFSASKENGNGI